MKKLFKTTLVLLSTMMLAGCANNPTSTEAAEPTLTVNLCLTRHGTLDGVKGTVNKDLWLEDWIAFTGNAGDPLPTKENVKSDVEGVEFVNWIAYEGTGKPVTYDKIPNIDNKVLYAFWSNPNGGQGGGGDIGGGGTDPDVPPTPTKEWKIKVADSLIDMEFNKDVDGGKEYKGQATFAENDVWEFSHNGNFAKVNEWEIGANNAFGKNQMINVDGKAKVQVAGTYDIYLKVYNNFLKVWVQNTDPNAPKGPEDPSKPKGDQIYQIVINETTIIDADFTGKIDNGAVNQYSAQVTFKAGDKFDIIETKSGKHANFYQKSYNQVIDTKMTCAGTAKKVGNDDGYGEGEVTVDVAGTYTFYIKHHSDTDIRVWIQ